MSATVNPIQTISQNVKILSTAVGQEVALMSVARGRYYSLDPIASDIWQRLAQPATLPELAAALSRDYAGDPQQIENDLQSLLAQLAAEGLIELADPKGGSSRT